MLFTILAYQHLQCISKLFITMILWYNLVILGCLQLGQRVRLESTIENGSKWDSAPRLHFPPLYYILRYRFLPKGKFLDAVLVIITFLPMLVYFGFWTLSSFSSGDLEADFWQVLSLGCGGCHHRVMGLHLVQNHPCQNKYRQLQTWAIDLHKIT